MEKTTLKVKKVFLQQGRSLTNYPTFTHKKDPQTKRFESLETYNINVLRTEVHDVLL